MIIFSALMNMINLLRVDTKFRAELNIYITACTQCSKQRQMGENYTIAKCLQVEIKRKEKKYHTVRAVAKSTRKI